MNEVKADKKGILNRTKSRFPKQIRNSSNPLSTSRKGRCSYSLDPIVSPFIRVQGRKDGRRELMKGWNDIVKVRMKINCRRYWMRSRISLGSGGSRCQGDSKIQR
jgi:hypothetical protein